MARLARALYEKDLSPQEVLKECYGVRFPPEFFVVAAAGPYSLDLLTMFTNQPWQLAVPLSRGGPAEKADSMEPTERKLFALDSDLVPLVRLLGHGAGSQGDNLILCYRLTELSAGRATVFDVREKARRPNETARRGESLLTVLHEHHEQDLRQVRWQQEQPGNWRAGSVDEEQVAESKEMLDLIEALQREASGRERR